MTQYWYRTTVDYGQGTIKEYLTDDFPDRNDYSTGNIIKTTRIDLSSLTALDIADIIEGNLENENYHSLTDMPNKLVKAIHSVVDGPTTSHIMQKIYEQGVFNI